MIQYWFATPIYYDILSGISNDLLIKRAYELKDLYNSEVLSTWDCSTFNTVGRNNFLGGDADIVLRDLARIIEKHVTSFAFDLGSNMNNKKAVVTDLWFNIAGPGAFQEYHQHNNSHFSAVYFPKSHAVDAGNLVFHSLVNQFDCFAFNEFNEAHTGPDIISNQVRYKPIEGQLVIFRSYLPHSVDVNKTKEDRLSMSFNFSLLEK